ncbi:GTP cyclohydrolase II [Rhodobacteraceae bacterium RKSG542]|uniref:GTP cyclohydrolase II n=1 Tax=Pseudovibrio flavus TaxID=2529854 RepID=UPI0012BCCCD9|nr:GTP cyclohydrolase II [Pseudovibrio flavus]MTI17204.1 GTP cyclohydrolase II [Pseudovibrio flavus]
MTAKAPHIRLTSHPDANDTAAFPIHWGERTAKKRGPIVATVTNPANRNTIGVHGGSYSLYRALAVSSGSLDPMQTPDLQNTSPTVKVGPHKSWFAKNKIVSLDPFGHRVAADFKDLIAQGVDVRPTIAITKANLDMPEIKSAVEAGRLKKDGKIVKDNGEAVVTKVAVDPVWYLPGLAARFETDEMALRRVLFEQTGGMYPELVTRPDISVFLPPIGGATLYIFGEVEDLASGKKEITCRVHDECNGSDVFGSDICTCRPYLLHGIEECIAAAQNGGVGLIVYNRKEGRALGEVTKFLVYNARKRQEGGDSAATYFERTECVAGVQDARFQELMPDILHWLGITRLNRFISMSDMKYDAIVNSGIEILERVPLPEELIPLDARVEMEAKKAAGYYTQSPVLEEHDLEKIVGRSNDDY